MSVYSKSLMGKFHSLARPFTTQVMFMSITILFSIIVVITTIYALIKRYETRLVLISAGLIMAIVSMKPMVAFQQFDKSMTNSSLIIAICSAMGFAAAVSLTKCDVHLVALLTASFKTLRGDVAPCLHVGDESVCCGYSIHCWPLRSGGSFNDSDFDPCGL